MHVDGELVRTVKGGTGGGIHLTMNEHRPVFVRQDFNFSLRSIMPSAFQWSLMNFGEHIRVRTNLGRGLWRARFIVFDPPTRRPGPAWRHGACTFHGVVILLLCGN